MENYFVGIETLSELKTAYKKLAKQFHQDNGGSIEAMQILNAEYDSVFETLKRNYNNEATEQRKTCEMAEDYRKIIETLINFEGINIEICGNWIWISGDTKQYKEDFKKVGLFWAKKKKMWYWRADQFKSYGRKSKSMDSIRNKYGSDTINIKRKERLEAQPLTW